MPFFISRKRMIKFDRVSYQYESALRPPVLAIDDLSLEIRRGSHATVLGRNGSGKSTLARLINALLVPRHGRVLVAGLDTADDAQTWAIRQRCGMVFQNPDNQIVGTTIEEDVAFGPENLGFSQEKMEAQIRWSLAEVGLLEEREKSPHQLSGGQKQKLAIAGILAMQPDCLILDEATAMLDPMSRRDLMNLVETLRREQGITVVNITHHMEEVLLADQVFVVAEGRLICAGTPAEVFAHPEQLRAEKLDLPAHMEIVQHLSQLTGQPVDPGQAFEPEQAATLVHAMLRTVQAAESKAAPATAAAPSTPAVDEAEPEQIVRVEQLTHTYNPVSSLATVALDQVSFTVRRGELLGIAGHSGSGKSTLIQHLNGLLRPQSGQVTVLGMNASVNANIRRIRERLALLFQYPEHQLFEETVYLDIAFGPRQMKLEASEVSRRVLWAARMAGLPESLLERSPFELSGGQKRRVAIAGVLAMQPDVLVLDEPAAGLDPAGREEILDFVGSLRQQGVTVLLVSHNMEDLARLADRILILKEGKVLTLAPTAEVFNDARLLADAGLEQPATTVFLRRFRAAYPALDCCAFTPADAAQSLLQAARQQQGVAYEQ